MNKDDMKALEDAFETMSTIAGWYLNDGDLGLYNDSVNKFWSTIRALKEGSK